LRTVANATNPALAINSHGRLGFLYQQVTGLSPNQRWLSYQRNANFATQTLLANDNVTPVSTSIDPFFFKVAPGVGRVVTAIANAGSFGDTCAGSFADEQLTIDNGGTGQLLISGIVSSSADFLAPSVLSYPIKLGVGDSVEVTIRFEPTSPGPKSGTITVLSNDPAGPHHVPVSGVGLAPRLSLVIADSGNFGRVCVGSFADEPSS
jgi:Abnormal spindle-like microcephaly-assoc'd, ASPM-SPD-2-Hydin